MRPGRPKAVGPSCRTLTGAGEEVPIGVGTDRPGPLKGLRKGPHRGNPTPVRPFTRGTPCQ